jgi:spore coat polysaccharide biosynthesis protein SpsF
VRGATDDVLARFVLAAATCDLTHVVRATADNPAVDVDAPRRTIDLLQRTGAAYVTECGLPYGTAVEAFSVEALQVANETTRDAYDREHVTPFLRRERSVVSVDALGPARLRRPDIRLTVDRPDDLAYIREVFDAVGERATYAPLSTIISAADFVRSQMLLRGAARR